jgi:hypothetical protein
MTFMHVLVVELLCQAVMGRISALECLLSSTRGSQWLHLVLFGIKWSRYLRTSALRLLARYRTPPGVAIGGPGAC